MISYLQTYLPFALAALAIALLMAVIIPAIRGAPRRGNEIGPALEQLLNSDLQNPVLTIRPKYSKRKFLQFDRYKADENVFGIEMAFPMAAWSEQYFPQVVTLASKTGRRYEIVDDDCPGLRFVFVRFHDSVSDAVEFSNLILTDIFEFAADYRFRVRIN